MGVHRVPVVQSVGERLVSAAVELKRNYTRTHFSGQDTPKMCYVKFLAFLNMCTATVVIIIQIATLARFNHMEMERVGVGIWGGLIIMASGVTNWIASARGKIDRTYNRFAGITAVLSLLVSIVMIGIFTAALVNLWDDPLCYIHHEEYLCDINRALDGTLVFGSALALIVNTSLSLIMCYCVHPEDKY